MAAAFVHSVVAVLCCAKGLVVAESGEYSLQDWNIRSCCKHDLQKMDVERQVFPNSDIPGVIPE